MSYIEELERARQQYSCPPREGVIVGLKNIFAEPGSGMNQFIDKFVLLVEQFPYITANEFAETWRLFADPNQTEDLDPRKYDQWSDAAKWLTADLLRTWLQDYCWAKGGDVVGATIAVLDTIKSEHGGFLDQAHSGDETA